MASSTTNPMASTSPKSESVLIEKPNSGNSMKVPTSETGTAMIGTGLVIWLGKRQLKHAKTGVMPFELRLVEVLNIASMSGLMIAIAASGASSWTSITGVSKNRCTAGVVIDRSPAG